MVHEPKPHWTWYDYKMNALSQLMNAGLQMGTDGVKIYVRKGKIEVFTCPKRVGWQNFYLHFLKGLVEKHGKH